MEIKPESQLQKWFTISVLVLIGWTAAACSFPAPNRIPTATPSPLRNEPTFTLVPGTPSMESPSETPTRVVLPSPEGTATSPALETEPGLTGTPAGEELLPGSCVPEEGEVDYGLVAWVSSGDTIVVDIQGQYRTVRYVGVDARENSSVAKARNEELVKGQVVKLVPGMLERDQYGQLLRYVFSGEILVNYALVREGVVSVDTSLEDSLHDACRKEFTAAQSAAQAETLGMWRYPEMGMVVSPAPNQSPTPAAQSLPTQAALTQAATQTLSSLQTTLPPGVTLTPTATRASSRPTSTRPGNQPTPGGGVTATLDPRESELYIVDIKVLGDPAKNESDEYIEIFNLGDQGVELFGWRINAGEPREDFYFPSYILGRYESCRVYTNEIHGEEGCSFSFGSLTELWINEGDCGSLYTPAGELFDLYCYGNQE